MLYLCTQIKTAQISKEVMQIKSFSFNPLRVNTYLLTDELSKETIVIDPGCQSAEEKQFLSKFIKDNNLIIKRLLNTHLHFDHIYGNRFIQETYGVGAYAAKEDMFFLNHYQDLLALFGMPMDEDALPLEGTIKDGDTIKVGCIELHVAAVPGHSPGSLAFYEPNAGCDFIGDTILEGSIGRTDLHKGNLEILLNSIRTKILTLPPQTVLYSGHGSSTTVEYEKEHNIYLRSL